MKRKMTVLENAYEIINYNTPGSNFALQDNKLSYFDNMQAICHWHEEIEIIRITKGTMLFYVNGHKYLLAEGDGLIVNSKQLHYGCSVDGMDCDFYCIAVHPDLYNPDSDVYKKYVEKIIHNDVIEGIYLDKNMPDEERILQSIDRLAQLYIGDLPGNELLCHAALYHIWFYFYKILSGKYDLSIANIDNNLILQRQMTNFIYKHYSEAVTLADIAAAGNVCRNKCCQLFKHYAQQSPINFLNNYRLKKSCELLKSTDLSITEVAAACGFNHLSYFEKLFYRQYAQTPRQYRDKSLNA